MGVSFLYCLIYHFTIKRFTGQSGYWGTVRVSISCYEFHKLGCYHYTNNTIVNEHLERIELSTEDWKSAILPLNYRCVDCRVSTYFHIALESACPRLVWLSYWGIETWRLYPVTIRALCLERAMI